MSRRPVLLLLLPLLGGCFPNGEWIPTLWGGEAIDDANDPDGAGVFMTDDGCEVTVDTFVVTVLAGALLAPEGTASAVLPGDQLFDVAEPGPHSMAGILMQRGPYPELAVVVGPASADTTIDDFAGRGQLIGNDNASSDANPIRGNAQPAERTAMEEAGATALVRGTLSCGTESAALDLLIDDELGLLRCPLGNFVLDGGTFGVTEAVVRAERLLATGEPLVDADDGDGVLTMADMDAAGRGDALREALRGAWDADGGSCAWESGEQ